MQRLLEFAQHHPILVGLAVVLAIAVLVYELLNRGKGSGLSPQETILLMNQGARVFDLRASDAYAAGHISGSKWLDVNELDKSPDSLKKYRERLVVLVCETGTVASAVARKLQAAGFTKVFNLRGGLAAWRAENLPLVKT